MSGGWEGSDRRQRLPGNWNALRAEVLKRDAGRCTWTLPSGKRCPRRATDVDHREPGDDHSLANLQALCGHHHGKKSAREGVQGRAKRRAKPPKRIEEHPGMIRRPGGEGR